MFNFHDEFLKVTKIVESPTSYLQWAAYITVGAVFRHRVYYDFPSRRTRVTPNIYVLLVGDSGSTRKSTPLKIANFLLKKVNCTKLIEGRASIQGVMKELAGQKREGKVLIKDAGALLYSEEFAAFLVKDPATTGILTDIYDYKDSHDVILKSEETMKLEKVCVSLFAATNNAFLQDMFTKTDLYGGLVGRTIFVIEDKARHKNLGLDDETKEDDWQPLINHLFKLSKMEGPVRLSGESKDFLEKWYSQTDFSRNESKTGYEHRAHTHVMKLALILAACEESFNMGVELHHCKQAVDIITSFRPNYHKLVSTVTTSLNSIQQAAKSIMRVLFNSSGIEIPRDEMLRSLFGEIDSETFDKAIITLEQSGFISVGGTSIANYTLTKMAREKVMGTIQAKTTIN